MKNIKFFLICMLLLSLFGCGRKTEENVENVVNVEDTKNEETPVYEKYLIDDTYYYKYNHLEIPVDLGFPKLDIEDFESDDFEPVTQIDNLIDCMYYIEYLNQDFNNDPAEMFKAFNSYISDDYEDIGDISVLTGKNTNFDLMYIKANGKYYAIDTYSLATNRRNIFIDSNKIAFDSLDELKEYVSGVFPYKDTDDFVKTISTSSTRSQVFLMDNGLMISTYINNEINVYNWDGYQIPTDLGFPKLDVSDFKSDDFEPITQIDNLIDCMYYIEYLNQDFNNNPTSMFKAFNSYISDDYEDIGDISVLTGKNTNFDLMYIKANGKYYAIDTYSLATNRRSIFIDSNKIAFDSLDELKEYVSGVFPYKDNSDYVKTISTSSTHSQIVLMDNGLMTSAYTNHGAPVYNWAGYEIPLGLGTPQYTNEEIDKIIASKDYKNVKNTINTFPDLINYIVRSDFTFSKKVEAYIGNTYFVDVGNIFYQHGEIDYTLSGLQTLMIKEGQCTSLSSMFSYVLKNNYPEIGYVDIKYNDGDGHSMIYILGNDGNYYLMNPVQYVMDAKNPQGLYEWCWFYEDDEIGVSSQLKDLMTIFINSKNPAKPNVRVSYLYTDVSDYSFCRNSHDGIAYYPEGTNAIAWLGSITGYFGVNDYVNQEYIYSECPVK